MLPAVVIMARTPVAGACNTRLINPLTPEECALFHFACLQDITSSLLGYRGPVFLYHHGEHAERLAGLPVTLRPQQGNDLGERMLGAAREVLPGSPGVILIGSDWPLVTADFVTRVAAIMMDHDLVIGPAFDGGYYLLGLKQPYPYLFAGIEWGGDRVLAQTLEAAKKGGLTVHLLPVQRDIDTWADLLDLMAENPQRSTDNARWYDLASALVSRYL